MLTADEILEAEEAADARRQSRGNGFIMRKVRDQSSVRLSNGVRMNWPTPKPEGEAYVWRYLPPSHFSLEVEGKEILFDAEEFRKFLRWV